MFKKKVPAQAVAAVVSAAAASTAAPARCRPVSRKAGGNARTLALIEKHRKILEEALRQKEEMDSITEEQTRLRLRKAQLHKAAATTAASAAAGKAAVSTKNTAARSQTSPQQPHQRRRPNRTSSLPSSINSWQARSRWRTWTKQFSETPPLSPRPPPPHRCRSGRVGRLSSHTAASPHPSPAPRSSTSYSIAVTSSPKHH